MIRLVFRPLTHVRRTICTSVSLRASTRVSSGFTLRTLSSPSFGSHHVCSGAILSLERSVDAAACAWHRSLSLCIAVFHRNTCKHNSLLGPCFKTGDMKSFRQHAQHADGSTLPYPLGEAPCKQSYFASDTGPPTTSPEARVCFHSLEERMQ